MPDRAPTRPSGTLIDAHGYADVCRRVPPSLAAARFAPRLRPARSGVLGSLSLARLAQSPSVTAPLLAVDTWRAYLASTPRVYFGDSSDWNR